MTEDNETIEQRILRLEIQLLSLSEDRFLTLKKFQKIIKCKNVSFGHLQYV